jgi:large subunit ribosomal protein L19
MADEKTTEMNLDIKPGMTVKVHEKIKEKNAKGVEKERVQIFEGIVIAHKHGKEIGATICVRKMSDGISVEKIYPLHSPVIAKIEVVRMAKVRRAKLNYLRTSRERLKEVKL